MKIIGQLPVAFFNPSRPENGLSFVGSSNYRSASKTIIASCYNQENAIHATTLQSDKTRAKTSIKLPRKKLLTRIPFAV